MTATSVSSEAPRRPAMVIALLGLALAFLWPLLLRIPGVSTRQITSIHDDLVGACIKWAAVAALAAIAFGARRRKPSELGLRAPGWKDVLAAIAAFAVAFVLSGVASRLVELPSALTNIPRMAAVPLGVRVVVVLSAAVGEEFIYRGYAIEELSSLAGRRGVAGVLSWALFTVSHVGLYGLSAALLVPGIVGAALTALYLWRRNLPACMLTHALMDGLFLILVPALVHAR